MDPPLKTWIHTKSDLATIEYHTSFPYVGDPFYQANIDQQFDRLNYAGVFRVPTIRFDGPQEPSPRSPSGYEALYDTRKASPSRATIELTGSYDPTTRTGTVTAIIENEESLPGMWQLRLAVVQNGIDYPAPNGIAIHDHVFRRFLPDAVGTSLDLSSDSVRITVVESFTINLEWQATDFSIVAMLQDDMTRTVEQGALLRINDLAPVDTATWGAVKALFR